MLRRVLGALLVAAATGATAAAGGASTPAIVFAADRAPAVTAEIYRIGLDGSRVDLSRSPYRDTSPVVSPDGRRVAFFSDRDLPAGRFALWLVGTDGRGLVRVSGPLLSGQEPHVAWSPDSSRLAVVAQARETPFEMGFYLAGPGRPQRLVLTDGVADPGWSPDGRVVTVQANGEVRAFSPSGRPLWSMASRGYAWSAGGLLATAAIKGTRIHSESGETLAAFPGQFFAWSPSGRRIAVIRNRLVDVRSASGRLLSTYAVPGFGVALAWVDDDRLAVSLGDRLSGVDLTTGRRFTPPAGVFGIRSGPLVADVRAGALRVTRLDGTHARTLARVRGCYDDGVLTGFAAVQFTPDRRSLVYQSYCPEAFDNLYAVGPEGGAVRRLTDVAAQQAQPAWSPDGTRIAFSQSRFTGLSCKGCPASLRVADADGSHARQLTHLPDCTFDTNPSWSPDGGSILVARANCNTLTLVVVSADGRRARDLHVPGTQSAWGPERIAYVDGSSVWTAAPDGSDRRRAGRGSSPAWSNGGRLAYLDGRTLVVDRRRTLLPFVSVLDLAWSPDGTRLAVAARLPGTAVPDVYTLNPNGTDVRRLTTNMDVSSLGW